MKTGIKHIYNFEKKAILFLLWFCIVFASCSKQADPVPVVPIQPTPTTNPSGDIQTFTPQDTLIAFNASTYIKWLVNNYNDYTIVTINGVKVPLYGDFNTGALTQNTTFTLALNNSKSASVTIKVADSLTSLLWNKGKRIRQTKLEYNFVPQGDSVLRWVDTTSILDKQIADQRTYFTLTGKTTTIQSTASIYPAPADGTFTANAAKMNMVWNGVTYLITTLDGDNLVITYYITKNGMMIHARNSYKYE